MKKILLTLSITLLTFNLCLSSDNNCLPDNYIAKGNAYVSGIIRNFSADRNMSADILYQNPIISEPLFISADISDDGKFFIEVPVLNHSLVVFNIPHYREYIAIMRDDTVFVEFDASKVASGSDISGRKDMPSIYYRFSGAFATVNNELGKLAFSENSSDLFMGTRKNSSLPAFRDEIISKADSTIEYYDSLNISPETKRLIEVNIRQNSMRWLVSHYTGHIRDENISEEKYADTFFSVFKDYDFASSDHLYGQHYTEFLRNCADLCIMKKRIERKPLERVSTEATIHMNYLESKDIFSDITGIESGNAFDLMDGIIFMNQIDKKLQLSDWQLRQVNNISAKCIRDEIFTTNNNLLREIERTTNNKSTTIKDVTCDYFFSFDNIIQEEYEKLKLIHIWDFSSFWTIEAHGYMKKLKTEYSKKNVRFIYIVENDIPDRQWKNNAYIQTGKFYKVNEEQLKSIRSRFELNGTPCFLVCNSSGKILLSKEGYSHDMVGELYEIFDRELAK